MTDFDLQRLALHLRPGNLPCSFHAVSLPERLKQAVLDLQMTLTRRDRATTTPPYDNLNRAVRALFPDLIAVGRGAWRAGQSFWLLADQPLPLRPLTLLVREWINETYAALPSHRREEALAVLAEFPLVSVEREVNLADWGEVNGTADYHGPGEIYNLLPHFVAAKFCRAETPRLSMGDFRKPFVRVPLTGLSANGAELMSWPPEKHTFTDKKHGVTAEYFSVVLTFTLQTLPFDPQPIVHCDVGVRRWVSRPLGYLEGSASVYIYAPVPWIEGGLSHGFTVAPMYRIKTGKAEQGEGQWHSVWGRQDVLMRILRRLHLPHAFPTADDVFDDPAAALTRTDGWRAAMTWATDLNYPTGPKHHEIGTGLFPLDRHRLWEWVVDVVSPDLLPVEAQRAVALPRFVPALKNPFFPERPQKPKGKAEAADEPDANENDETDEEISGDTEDSAGDEETRLAVTEEAQRQRCQLLQNAVGSQVEVGLYYDSGKIRDGIEEVLQDLFGVAPQTPSYEIPGGVTVWWNPVPKSGDFYTPLFAGDTPGAALSSGRVREATEKRRDAIKKALPPATRPALGLIELSGKDSFKPYADPKTAIRKGFAHTNRLTQFLVPPEGGLPDDWQTRDLSSKTDRINKIVNGFRKRLLNATLDGLRQLGVQMPVVCRAKSAPLHSDSSLPSVHYVGYWVAKHTRSGSRTGVGGNLPLFIRVDGTTGAVTARAMGVGGHPAAQAWMPYREFLLCLGRDEYPLLQAKNDRRRFGQYTEETVKQFLLGDDYLLFAHAQNSRLDGWPYLANKYLAQDRVGFAQGSSEPVGYYPGLRLLRVRDHTGSETPENLVFKNTPQKQHELVFAGGKGIYPVGARTFYIRTKRPDTMRVSATSSMLTAFDGKSNQEMSPRPQETTPHVRLLEVATVGLQAGDDPFAWAALTLKLCEATTHTGGETALPLPLHLAKQTEEYLHPLPAADPDTEDDDD